MVMSAIVLHQPTISMLCHSHQGTAADALERLVFAMQRATQKDTFPSQMVVGTAGCVD